MEFRKNMRKLTVSIAFVIGTHFLAGFILLVVVYRLLIRNIHRMRVTIRCTYILDLPYKLYTLDQEQ